MLSTPHAAGSARRRLHGAGGRSGWCENRSPCSHREARAGAVQGELGRASCPSWNPVCAGTGPGVFLGAPAGVLQSNGDLADLPGNPWALDHEAEDTQPHTALYSLKGPSHICACKPAESLPHAPEPSAAGGRAVGLG